MVLQLTTVNAPRHIAFLNPITIKMRAWPRTVKHEVALNTFILSNYFKKLSTCSFFLTMMIRLALPGFWNLPIIYSSIFIENRTMWAGLRSFWSKKNGASEETLTLDLVLGKEAL